MNIVFSLLVHGAGIVWSRRPQKVGHFYSSHILSEAVRAAARNYILSIVE